MRWAAVVVVLVIAACARGLLTSFPHRLHLASIQCGGPGQPKCLSCPSCHQSAGEEQLLAPRVATVAITGVIVFLRQVEGFLGLGVGEQRHRLSFELVESCQFAELIDGPVESVDVLTERGPAIETAHFASIRQTNVRH